MGRICQLINRQDRELAKRANVKKANASTTAAGDNRFYLNLLRMEVERVKFVLKAYLRARILKIERHLIFIVEKD